MEIKELESISLNFEQIRRLKRQSVGYYSQIILLDIIYFEKNHIEYSFDDLIAIAVDTHGMNKGYYWEDTEDILDTAMCYYFPVKVSKTLLEINHLIGKKYIAKDIKKILIKSNYENYEIKNFKMIEKILNLNGYLIIKKILTSK